MKSRWEIHKGVRFFYFDVSNFGLDDKGVFLEMDEADAVIMAEPLDSVLILNDIRNSAGSMEVLKHLQTSADRTTSFIAKAAVVGAEGSKQVLLQVINRFTKHPIIPFDDVEKAKDWLVSDKI